MKLQINYFLSGWIANLGVVPLFSFAFFLLDPAFLDLSLLLVVVCCVLDAILISSNCINKIFKEVFLSSFHFLVKVFIFTTSINAAERTDIDKDIFISKGEQIELNIGQVTNFSVGNKEVLKYLYQQSKGSLLVKGKSLGISDIICWNKSKKKRIWRIYVISKKEYLNKASAAEALEKSGLDVKLQGNTLYAHGEVKSITSYKTLIQARSSKNLNIIYDLKLTADVRNKIIAKIYENLYWQGADKVNCNLIEITFYCKVYGSVDTKAFEDQFGVKFTKYAFNTHFKNYNLKFVIIHLEDSNSHSLSSGLSQIESSLKDAIASNSINLELENILIRENTLTAKTLANPIIESVLNKSFKIQIGGEVPFRKSSLTETLDWKFAGLKIRGKLSDLNGKLLLEYNSELTVPQENSVQGPKGAATLYIQEGEVKKLFSLDIDNLKLEKQSIPFLSRVPLLKYLITREDSINSRKKIVCYLKITSGKEL